MQHQKVLFLVEGISRLGRDLPLKLNDTTLFRYCIYKELTDQIDIVDVGNEFVEKYEERKNIFGKFSKEDLI